MTATTRQRRHKDPFAVPAPTRCVACAGDGCPVCDGSGWESAWFRLGPMRTDGYRRCIYRPSCVAGMGRLCVAAARHATAKLTHAEYAVAEFECDPCEGRAFYVCKLGTARRHEVLMGFSGTAICTCEGTTYEAAAKANQRAFEAHGETFATRGCVHLDAVAALLKAGWLDLPVPEGPGRGAQQESVERRAVMEVAA